MKCERVHYCDEATMCCFPTNLAIFPELSKVYAIKAGVRTYLPIKLKFCKSFYFMHAQVFVSISTWKYISVKSIHPNGQ